jgi:four helix bundle protein
MITRAPFVDPLAQLFRQPRDDSAVFDHDRLDVYQRAVQLLDLVDQIVDQMPSGRAHLKDQLDRAATSVVLNIAEGAGEFSPRDKRRFYRMARRSATESAAILAVVTRRKQAPEELLRDALELLHRIVSMLVRMAVPTRPSQTSSGSPRFPR